MTERSLQTSLSSLNVENSFPLELGVIQGKPTENPIASLRSRVSNDIKQKCDRIKIPDWMQPVKLSDIYTDSQVWGKIASRSRLKRLEQKEILQAKHGDHFIFNNAEQTSFPSLQAIEKHSKLVILGKVGTGKTTLLKHISLQCVTGQFQPHLLPILVTLRDFAEDNIQPSLWEYITWKLPSYTAVDDQLLKQLLHQGELIFLLDGLDEVSAKDSARVIRQIVELSDRYPHNHFVITSRTTDYLSRLEQFIEVEIADFDDEQISMFIQKWFKILDLEAKAKEFITFIETHQTLHELATNPLMLTMMCSAFVESEELLPYIYREGFYLLFHKWQASKTYSQTTTHNHSLSLSHKKDLLDYLAMITLDHGEIFWEYDRLEKMVRDYLHANPELESLHLDINSLIKSLDLEYGLLTQRAKGVYSFSYIAFQEYLAACKLAASTNPQAIAYLLDRITDQRWYNVIQMVVGMLPNADQFLLAMKQKIDQLLAHDRQFQKFLVWVNQQALYLKTTYSPVAVRALFFDINFEKHRIADRARALDLAHERSLERARARALGQEIETEISVVGLDLDYALNLALNLDFALYFVHSPTLLELACALEPQLDERLRKLREQLPNPSKEMKRFKKWWQVNGLNWTKQLREAIIQNRKNIQEWEFTEVQEKILQEYYYANKLLVDCLHSSCYVTPFVQEEIEMTLLLVSTFEKR